jgi:hypothetical protein
VPAILASLGSENIKDIEEITLMRTTSKNLRCLLGYTPKIKHSAKFLQIVPLRNHFVTVYISGDKPGTRSIFKRCCICIFS